MTSTAQPVDAIVPQKRLGLKAYLALVLAHYLANWKAYTLPVVAVLALSPFIRIDVNVTPSLPNYLFVTLKGLPPKIERGDYIAFRWHGGGPIPAGTPMCKIVVGLPGDTVRMDENRRFLITHGASEHVADKSFEQFVGQAKTHSRQGLPLAPGPVGVIPADRYYVMATHPDSLDSRYALSGWIHADAIVGRTYVIF